MAQEYCLLEGIPYHLEEDCAFSKQCCVFQRIPAQFVGVLFVEQALYRLKGKYNLIKKVLYRLGILPCCIQYCILEKECPILNSCYILQKKMFPFKGRLHILLQGHPASSRRTVIFCKGQCKDSCNYFTDIKVQIRFTIFIFELCVLAFMILCLITLMYLRT